MRRWSGGIFAFVFAVVFAVVLGSVSPYVGTHGVASQIDASELLN